MAKIDLTPIANLDNPDSATTAINANFAEIEAFVDTLLSRDGTTPNVMTDILDMNANRIINLPAPITATEPARHGDIQPLIDRAEDAAEAAEYAAEVAQASAAYAQSGAGGIEFDSKAIASAWVPSVAPEAIRLRGYYTAGDGGEGAYYHKVAVEPAHEGKFSLTDAGATVRWYELYAVNGEIRPEFFGAFPDGTDHAAGLNYATAYLHSKGGGVVRLSRGIYLASEPVITYSDIVFRGAGWTVSGIKATDTGVFTDEEAVVMSADFVTGANKWNYYLEAPDFTDYPSGLHMACGFFDMYIDGNRANVADANGLMIYGGKWTFNHLAVINTDGHGIWTEAGVAGSSNMGDDWHDFLNMHESSNAVTYISNANKHGWLFRGPNDTDIGHIQVKNCGWAGFFQDRGSYGVGGLKFKTIHCYSCRCEHTSGYQVELAAADGNYIYSDNPLKGGVNLYNSDSHIDKIRVYRPNSSKVGDFYGIRVDRFLPDVYGYGTSVGETIIEDYSVATTSGTDGGHILITSNSIDTYFGRAFLKANVDNTIAQVGIIDKGTNTVIDKASIINFAGPLSVGMQRKGDIAPDPVTNAYGGRYDIEFNNCTVGFEYDTAVGSRNWMQFLFIGCATDYTFTGTMSNLDTLIFTSTSNTFAELNLGKVVVSHHNDRFLNTTFAASYTPNGAGRSKITLNKITSNLTINAPTNPVSGDIWMIHLVQDTVGGYNVTWNSVFDIPWSNTGNVAGARAFAKFMYWPSNDSEVTPSQWVLESYVPWH
jgi:hypothetical protein